jgi:hypothetical protein
VLCAARRLSSWAASIELRAVSELSGRRAAADGTASSRRAEHVSDEVAAALTLTGRSAYRLLNLAVAVQRLPAAAAALAAGRIDVPKVIVFTDELAGLGGVAAAAVAALAAPDAPRLTSSELRGVLRRAVLALDPGAARKRREKAQQDARVECWPELHGTAALAGRDLPPAEALAADQNIDARARALKDAGAPGTLAQLRSRVFLTLLAGRPLYTLLPGHDISPGTGPGPEEPGQQEPGQEDPGQEDHHQEDPGQGHGQDRGEPGADDEGPGRDDGGDGGDGGPGPGGGPGRPGPGPGTGGPAAAGPSGGPFPGHGLTGSLHLTVPLTTWLGLTSQPGDAAGHGPLDAAASRDLAAALAASPATRCCLTITSPSGTAIGHGCAKPGHPPPRPPPPGTAHPGGPPPPGTAPPGTAPPGTGPAGQRAGPAPPRAAHPGGPAAPGGRQRQWLAGIKITWLETGACGHPRQTFAYQPSPALRHLLKTRDRTCCFPGCRRPAVRCDDDHTQPYDQGGRTCECNMAALCRRHHRAKQAPGWHLHQTQPGTLTWTLPSGRTHTVTPRPYPA